MFKLLQEDALSEELSGFQQGRLTSLPATCRLHGLELELGWPGLALQNMKGPDPNILSCRPSLIGWTVHLHKNADDYGSIDSA